MYQLIQGDCIESMKRLEAGTVQCCVTSPPYFGLRDYGHDGQIGLEDTPEAYVAKLVDVFREVRRLLRDDGTLWLNLGDSYVSSATGNVGTKIGLSGGTSKTMDAAALRPSKLGFGLAEKNLIGIPWRVAFALQADGWYLRSDIIWHKPNPMPESVTDRPTKAHEYIFLLSKSAHYFYDADAIKEAASESTNDRDKYKRVGYAKENRDGYINHLDPASGEYRNCKGQRNRRSVWTVTTKPYSGAHFATFPPDLIEPCILAGTSAHGCCAACGAPWERVVERKASTAAREGGNGNWVKLKHLATGQELRAGGFYDAESVTTGWQPTCTCGADVVPCTVLDPFNGSGTTGAVSLKHGRHYIGLELNPDYITLAHTRITQSQPMLAGIL